LNTSVDKADLVSTAELRGLLADILTTGDPTCVRLRVFGEKWHPYFMRIVNVSSKELTLINETTGQLEVVQNLGNIVQFEIDSKFRKYQPHFHYDVWHGDS
jgi:hypothetical protein